MKRFQITVLGFTAALAMVGCGKKDDQAPAAKDDVKTPVSDQKPAVAPTPTPTPTPTATGDAVTLTYVVEPVGMSWSEADTMTMNAKIAVQGQELQIVNTATKKKKIEVLATTAEAVTKAKMTYAEYSDVQKMGPQEKTEGAAVVGKTYVVELVDGKLVVTLDGGGAASAEEIALVTDDNKKFGKPDTMGIALSGMTFKMGEKQSIPPEKLAGVFGGDDGKMEAATIDMTLTEMRGKNAVFLMDVTLAGANGPMNIAAIMKATAVVDPAAARLHDMTLEGTLTFSGQAEGTGTMTGHKSATY